MPTLGGFNLPRFSSFYYVMIQVYFQFSFIYNVAVFYAGLWRWWLWLYMNFIAFALVLWCKCWLVIVVLLLSIVIRFFSVLDVSIASIFTANKNRCTCWLMRLTSYFDLIYESNVILRRCIEPCQKWILKRDRRNSSDNDNVICSVVYVQR